MNVSKQLVQAALHLRHDDMPEDSIHAAQVSLLDALAVMFGAIAHEAVTHPFQHHALAAGAGPATLLAGGTAQASAAALANGALAHALDFEDTHDATGLHPNAVVVPAALAIAEAQETSGRDFLVALAIGSDVNCRIGLALQDDPAQHGWYHPPMIGMIGATIAASRLLGLDVSATVSAVSLALCQFSLTDALKRSPATDLRAVRDGFAARAAVEAVLLAQAGLTGTEDPLEGTRGLFPLLTGQKAGSDLLAGFGTRFHNGDVSIKDWPCCRGTHPYIASALEVRESVPADQIAEIGVTVRPPDDMLLLPAVDRQAPETAISARFSIPFTMASAVLFGAPSLAHFGPKALENPALRCLAARISLDQIGADATRAVRLRLRDGRELNLPATLPESRRAHDIPLAGLSAKLEDCLAPFPRLDAARLIANVAGLPECTIRQFAEGLSIAGR